MTEIAQNQLSVTIFGAGITGLTAAHELADRGFRVWVVEPRRGLDPSGREEMTVGGMAMTQYMQARPDLHGLSEPDPNRKTPLLPGEHGFRFFPSYYHHVWDTMQRIPLYEHGHKTGETVFDNVAPCITQGNVAKGRQAYVASRKPPRSLVEFIEEMTRLFNSGFKPSDVTSFMLRLMRYMCTSSARRAAEYEDLSVEDYVLGRRSPGAPAQYHFSPEFIDQLELAPKILSAFDAKWGDARSNFSTAIQLMVNELLDLPKTDGVLRGPTTEAWLLPWRTHLEMLGVTFVSGSLERLDYDDRTDEVHARLSRPLHDREGRPLDPAQLEGADYFVVALGTPEAEAVSANLPQIGVPGALQGYTTTVPVDIRDPARGVVRRDPYSQCGLHPWDRLQTLTGLQYFFDRDFQLVHGHLYFPTSPWGLSGIFEHDFWRNRPTLANEGYASVLSVDLGAWNAKSPVTGKSPAESSVYEIAQEVWRQIKVSIGEVGGEGGETQEVPDPSWFAIDTNLEFGGVGQPVARNRTPYLIPIVGEFAKRPGAEPWNPAAGVRTADASLPRGVWQAGHGGCWVHWNRLVYAGAYSKTFTRLTSMEASNEAARHAVNAILDHVIAKSSHFNDRRDGLGFDWNVPTGFTTARFLSPVYQPTRLGDYCQIWNIEDHEVPDLVPARRIDEACFRLGLPHPWELLGIDSIGGLLSWIGAMGKAPGGWPGWPMPGMGAPGADGDDAGGPGGGGAGGTRGDGAGGPRPPGFDWLGDLAQGADRSGGSESLLRGLQKLREAFEEHAERMSSLYGGPGRGPDRR